MDQKNPFTSPLSPPASSSTPTFTQKIDVAAEILRVMSTAVLMSPKQIKLAAKLPANKAIFSVLSRLARAGKVESPIEGQWRLTGGPPILIPPAPPPTPIVKTEQHETPASSSQPKKRKLKKQSTRPSRG